MTWDAVTPDPVPAVMMTPGFKGLQYVTPRLFTMAKEGAACIKLTLVAEGEGFKKAVLYNPAGRAAATLERFVDLGDKGHYEYTLEAQVPARDQNGIWALSLQDVALKQAEGLSPYFATSPQSFFRPAR